ncbi:TPA: transposase, partial [Escherichia coli]|nr:transposase [Escherichia coli]
MSRKTQRYSKEFKAEAVRTVLENQLSISEGASRLSLPEGTLGQWSNLPIGFAPIFPD